MDQKKEEVKTAHLFVLVHGLWGEPNHLSTVEKVIKELLPECSEDEIVTLKPSSFRFWKTYDGLRLNSLKIIEEMFYEIETLKQKNNYLVKKISIVGYSLGGLLARYVIGILNEMSVFETIEPVIFTTFATPHVGVEFFKSNVFERTANKLGKYLLGQTGREMFLGDSNETMKKLADPKETYFQGLQKFKVHILLANIKNDRTVSFFTSYITEYAPFENWEDVKIKYLKNLPVLRIQKARVRPKFVDLSRSTSVRETDSNRGNIQEDTSILRSSKIARVLVISLFAFFFFPLWITLVIVSSFFASLYSMLKMRVLPSPDVKSHWVKVIATVFGHLPVDLVDARRGSQERDRRAQIKRFGSFKGVTSKLAEDTMDGGFYTEERLSIRQSRFGTVGDLSKNEDGMKEDLDTNKDTDGNEKSLKNCDLAALENDRSIEEHLEALKIKDVSNFPLFKDLVKLPLDKKKKFIVKSLNTIDWIKIPVYIDAWNAHDVIVARRGPFASAKGTATIVLWCSILRKHLHQERVSQK